MVVRYTLKYYNKNTLTFTYDFIKQYNMEAGFPRGFQYGRGEEEGKRMYRKISHRSSTTFLKFSFFSVNNND
jgi:hypothetical protein